MKNRSDWTSLSRAPAAVAHLNRTLTEREQQQRFAQRLLTINGLAALAIALVAMLGLGHLWLLIGVMILGLASGIALALRADSLADDLDVARRKLKRETEDADELERLKLERAEALAVLSREFGEEITDLVVGVSKLAEQARSSETSLQRVTADSTARPRQLTPAQQRFLDFVDGMADLGLGAHTGGPHRRRDAEALVKAGILRREMMVVCDGDGWTIEPEREREGYKRTTDTGHGTAARPTR